MNKLGADQVIGTNGHAFDDTVSSSWIASSIVPRSHRGRTRSDPVAVSGEVRVR